MEEGGNCGICSEPPCWRAPEGFAAPVCGEQIARHHPCREPSHLTDPHSCPHRMGLLEYGPYGAFPSAGVVQHCASLVLHGASCGGQHSPVCCPLPPSCSQQLAVSCTARSAGCTVTLETAFSLLPTAVRKLNNGRHADFCLQLKKRPNTAEWSYPSL